MMMTASFASYFKHKNLYGRLNFLQLVSHIGTA